MAEDLKTLISQRSTIKARMTIFQNYLEPLKLIEVNKMSSVIFSDLQLRLERFKHLFDMFDNVQNKIEMISEGNLDVQIAKRETMESSFCTLIATAQTILDANISNTKSPNSQEGSVHSSCAHSNNLNIKLPTINLPVFDGNYLHWLEFRDTFDSLINQVDMIPQINKFHYLRNSLKGAAAVVIQSIEFSGDNYKLAWDLLCNRYNNKRILTNNHLKALFQFEPLHKESYRAIRFMIDTYTKNLRSLENLKEPTESWDTLIIFIMTSKLDSVTARKWEEYRGESTSSPTLKDFLQFLRNRADFLETVQFKGDVSKTEKQIPKETKYTKSFVSSSSGIAYNKSCILCKQSHLLYECSKFKEMALEDKFKEVSKFKLCSNCLRQGHHHSQCRMGPCRFCKKKHNSLLHRFNPNYNPNNSNTKNNLESTSDNNLPSNLSKDSPNSFPNPVSLSTRMSNQVLLCTAEVEILDSNTNKTYLGKALLDSGSQSSFLTESAKNKMNLLCSNKNQMLISGINDTVTKVGESCNITIKSRSSSFTIDVSCFIIPQITSLLPSVEVDTTKIDLPSNITLADPNFFRPSEIHILLGADVFWDIVESNQIKTGRNKPTLQSSKLGWLVAGPTGSTHLSNNIKCNFSQEIRESLAKFWEIEEISSRSNVLSKCEELCESHFIQTTRRLPNGRFSVMIPLSEKPEDALGESYAIAKRRFLNLERKLSKSPDVKRDYAKFIHEYASLGHLTEIQNPKFGYYLPHHSVIREQSESTKLRVVFDASCKTSSGKSFNDIQLVGPVVQDDLLSILLRFRQNTYVVTGDIEKMYRQILVDESQRHLQLILWRDDENQALKTLQLNTVTYGTASAPFLSTRCLVQLGEECPDLAVAEVLKHDFYVDDLNTGSDTKVQLKHLIAGVIQTLNEACLPLRKFRTNAPDIFDNLHISNEIQDFSKQATVLGLNWSPDQDILQFSISTNINTNFTKRTILSKSCQIFDPLGLLSACTIVPKIILQKLWQLKLDWDDPIPVDLNKDWRNFESNIGDIANIKIPRHVLCPSPIVIEAHCFSDASQVAYSACIYLKSIDKFGNYSVRLLCAKARVAPLKPELTIPRLELMGALLGARLHNKVIKSLRVKINKSVFWTDSTIVLGWIKTKPKTLKMFVCNRIQEIRDLTNDCSWRHVPTNENPADFSSRGVAIQSLGNNELWWTGPNFLSKSEDDWPQNKCEVNLPETKVTCSIQIQESIIPFQRYSKLSKLQRVTAYIFRFINNCKVMVSARQKGELTNDELQNALINLAKISQRESFPNEIHNLKNTTLLNRKSNILSLNPFLDKYGVLRVGGRIQNATHCPYNQIHPILIDSKHTFTKLLFMYEHNRLLHCGPQQLLSSVREQFWPTGGRVLSKSTVNKCYTCTRLKAKPVQQLMGNLPPFRVTPAPPFESCGADFAGPFFIINRKGRGAKSFKCYLCLFVCLSTKAIHLEVVSDLTSNAFILCLRRFISRRGKPKLICCDNGKNFVGAKGELNRMLQTYNQSVSEFAREEGITFKFIPPYSPNFGGIWEAGVKAAKFHLKRIAGNTNLTFEELSTLFAQIEAILNSRPLTPLSADPSDLNPLTPGHFLIGRPLTSLPSPVTEKITLNRYQLLEKLRQHFWKRWSAEYLSELQRRVKWQIKTKEYGIGDLVVIQEDNVPPMKWIIGRIKHLHPGPDGVCRVVDVQTTKGILRRAIRRICPLLSQETIES